MFWEYALLCAAAAMAGAVNSVAGGGTLLTFPVLVAMLSKKFGGDEAHAQVVANQTSTVALVPGICAAAWGYRKQTIQALPWLKLLILPSIVGGLLGGWLVTVDHGAFSALVPWLILTAALLFVFQPQISRLTGIGKPHSTPSRAGISGIIVFQFFVAVYGGYFGAGIGILMLSALAMMGLADIHIMNGLKNSLAFCINTSAILMFATRGEIAWEFALPMIVASICGGYLGATLAQKIDRQVIRRIVVGIGFSLATYYFYRQFSK
jgi:uncharacterized membrane protein YfcA